MINDVQIYLEKAQESLAGAESERGNRRYNNCANRAYYACFQAAIAMLLDAGVTQPSSGKWRQSSLKRSLSPDSSTGRSDIPVRCETPWSGVRHCVRLLITNENGLTRRKPITLFGEPQTLFRQLWREVTDDE